MSVRSRLLLPMERLDYYKNKYATPLIPYDSNHTGVLRMQDVSGTNVADAINSANNATADASLTITTGYKADKLCRQFDVTKKIAYPIKFPIGAKTIRFKIYVPVRPSVTYFIIDSMASTFTNVGFTMSLGANGILNFYGSNGSNNTIFLGITTQKALATNTWYDIQFTWDGTTNADMIKTYIKAITGVDTGKWYDTSGVAQTTIVPNMVATASIAQTNVDSYSIFIGQYNTGGTDRAFAGYMQDLQISNIARTNMLDYI